MDPSNTPSARKGGRATLTLRTNTVEQGAPVTIEGANWPLDVLRFKLGRRFRAPGTLLHGQAWGRSLVPGPDGRFLIRLSTRGLKPGKHQVEVQHQESGSE